MWVQVPPFAPLKNFSCSHSFSKDPFVLSSKKHFFSEGSLSFPRTRSNSKSAFGELLWRHNLRRVPWIFNPSAKHFLLAKRKRSLSQKSAFGEEVPQRYTFWSEETCVFSRETYFLLCLLGEIGKHDRLKICSL